MSDESLIRALRALDRPVDVDPTFDDALFAILEREYAQRRQPRPGPTLLFAAALLVALLVGGAIAVGSGLLRLPAPDALVIRPFPSDDECSLPRPPGETGITQVIVPGVSGDVVFAACAFWSAEGNAIQRIDPTTNEITATIGVGGADAYVPDMAADGDEVWATVWVDDGRWQLVQIDPGTNSVVREIELPATIGDHLIVTGGRAWLSGFEFPEPGVIDLETGEVIAQIDDGGFLEGFGSVWANSVDQPGVMLRIDPRSLEMTTFELPHPEANLTAASATGLWVTSPVEGRIYKLSLSGEIVLTVDEAWTGGFERDTAVRAALGGDVYATSHIYLGGGGDPDGTELLRIDDRTGELVEQLDHPMGGYFEEIWAAGDSIWVVGDSEVPSLVRYIVPAAR